MPREWRRCAGRAPPSATEWAARLGATSAYTAVSAARSGSGSAAKFQNSATRPPWARTRAAFEAPACGLIQCQAWPQVRSSNRRPRSSHASKRATSTPMPFARPSARRAPCRARGNPARPATRRPFPYRSRRRGRAVGGHAPIIDQLGRVRRPRAVIQHCDGAKRLRTGAIVEERLVETPSGGHGRDVSRLNGVGEAPLGESQAQDLRTRARLEFKLIDQLAQAPALGLATTDCGQLRGALA
jgi:hypothetical protein